MQGAKNLQTKHSLIQRDFCHMPLT